MKILLVDSNQIILDQLERFITHFDPTFQIFKIHSGYEASICIQQGFFDMLFTEINLPDLRGDLFVDFVQNNCFKIGITDTLSNYDIHRHFDAFLFKPLIPEEITRVLINAQFRFIPNLIF